MPTSFCKKFSSLVPCWLQVYISAVREAEAAGKPRPPLSAGFTYELCAGIIDKAHLDLKGIAHEEVGGWLGRLVLWVLLPLLL